MFPPVCVTVMSRANIFIITLSDYCFSGMWRSKLMDRYMMGNYSVYMLLMVTPTIYCIHIILIFISMFIFIVIFLYNECIKK